MGAKKPWRDLTFAHLSEQDMEALRWRVRVSELYGKMRLLAVCGAGCGRGKVFVPYRIRKRFGDERIGRLEERLRCDECGNKKGNRFYIVWSED